MPDLDPGGVHTSLDATAGARHAFRRVLRRTVEGDLLPRLLMQHRAGPVPPSLAVRLRDVDEGELNRFLDLLRAPDDLLVEGYLHDRAEAGEPLTSIFQDLLAPAANRLGGMWEEDTCNFLEVTLACARLQRSVRRLGARFRAVEAGYRRGRALVCGVDGDQHTLGAILVAETLAREGYAVTLGPPFDAEPRRGCIDLVAISVANSDRWLETRARIVRLRRRHRGVRVILGGGAVARHPELAATAGADAWALDLAGLVDLARAPAEA